MTVDDLDAARALSAHLGERFCLTYVKAADAAEALHRMGACPDTVQDRAAPELTDRMAAALTLGAWSVVIEPAGSLGTSLEAVSRGTAAVSVQRDHAAAHFEYAVDGETVSGFDPGYPAEETMWGSDPGLLRPLMDALGLRTPGDESDTGWQDAEARAIVLAQRITGVRVPDEPLSVARLSAQLEPWFVTPAALLRADRRHPWAAEMVAAAEAAPAPVQLAVAVAQVREQATGLGIADAPGLAEALEAAARGSAGPVAADSPLGFQIRAWLTASRATGDSAPAAPGVDAAAGPAAPGVGGAAGPAASALGLFLTALRGVLDPDPRVAVLAALRPLARVDDGPARAAALHALLSSPGSGAEQR